MHAPCERGLFGAHCTGTRLIKKGFWVLKQSVTVVLACRCSWEGRHRGDLAPKYLTAASACLCLLSPWGSPATQAQAFSPILSTEKACQNVAVCANWAKTTSPDLIEGTKERRGKLLAPSLYSCASKVLT